MVHRFSSYLIVTVIVVTTQLLGYKLYWSQNCQVNSEIIQNSSTFSVKSTKLAYQITFAHSVTFSGDKNVTQIMSKSELDFSMRLRKLLHWSVRQVNLQIRGQDCGQWWANPLSVKELKEVSVSPEVTAYTLTFEIQPGRILFETVVHATRNFSKNVSQLQPEILHLFSARRLDVLPQNCTNVSESLRKICLCSEEKLDAEKYTAEARLKWKVNDPESSTWPPDASFMVQDYLNVGKMDGIYISPSNSSQICGAGLKLVIFISCYPQNFDVRQAIRQTFGSVRFLEPLAVKLFFVFDKISDDKKLLDEIHSEATLYGDIIQTNIQHNYHNLTLRQLSVFNWLVTLCKGHRRSMPPWLLKADQDYFINVPLVLKVAQANPDAQLVGGINCGQPVQRDQENSKFYVPRYLHPAAFYPGYLSGSAWLIRTDTLPLLLQASLTVPLIPVEDVYVTGMLTREVLIEPGYVTLFGYERRVGPCVTKQMVNSEFLNIFDLYVHWSDFKEKVTANCSWDNKKIFAELPNTSYFQDCCF